MARACPRGRAERSMRPVRAGRDGGAGVVALEFALHLPLVALLVVAVLSLVGVVRASLLLHEAARVGARVAAVDADDAAVARAVVRVAGADVQVEVGPRRPDQLVAVEVRSRHRVMGLGHDLAARSVAMVEPVVRP